MAKNGWGLEDEDLDDIIKIENLKDVTQRFSDQIKTIIERFGSVSHLRIVAFNEQSGVDRHSKSIFRLLIQAGRDVNYNSLLSNKECCVILIYPTSAEPSLKSYGHILCHEYAHHFQFAYAGFPYYIVKQLLPEPVPPFAKPSEIGPEVGSVFVDDLRLPDLHTVIHDSIERISDIICEGLLREKNLIIDFLEWFQHKVALYKDPTVRFRQPVLKRYVERLVLRDNAEIGATVRLAYPNNDDVTMVISQGKKFAIRLNKKLPKASKVHDEIFNLCVNTDFQLFKSPEKVVNYTKKVMDLLNIEIKTSENW